MSRHAWVCEGGIHMCINFRVPEGPAAPHWEAKNVSADMYGWHPPGIRCDNDVWSRGFVEGLAPSTPPAWDQGGLFVEGLAPSMPPAWGRSCAPPQTPPGKAGTSGWSVGGACQHKRDAWHPLKRTRGQATLRPFILWYPQPLSRDQGSGVRQRDNTSLFDVS